MHVLEGARAQAFRAGLRAARPGAELSCVCDAGAAGGLGCRRGLPCPLPAGSAAGERVLGSRLLHGLIPLPVAVSRREPLAGPDSTGSGLNPCPEQARGPGPCSPLLRGHEEAGWGRARVSGGLKRGPLLQRPPGGGFNWLFFPCAEQRLEFSGLFPARPSWGRGGPGGQTRKRVRLPPGGGPWNFAFHSELEQAQPPAAQENCRGSRPQQVLLRARGSELRLSDVTSLQALGHRFALWPQRPDGSKKWRVVGWSSLFS